MLNVGTPELLLILLVALVVLGPKRLPDVARQAGRAMAEVRRFTSGIQDEIDRAVHAPADPAPVPADEPVAARPARRRPLVAS
jgi:Tat protein translocase TatB subunit